MNELKFMYSKHTLSTLIKAIEKAITDGMKISVISEVLSKLNWKTRDHYRMG